MKIHSDSFEHGKPIPPEFAMGALGGFGGNRNPHLAWDGAPAGTRFWWTLSPLTPVGKRCSMHGRSRKALTMPGPTAR